MKDKKEIRWEIELCEKAVKSRTLMPVWIYDFIRSLLSSQKQSLKKKVEKMKKKQLYHWMNFGDIDGSEEFTQGVVENSKDAPMWADGHSAEYVYNEALSDILKLLEE